MVSVFTSDYVNTETTLHFFSTTTAECYPLILAQREEGRLNNEIRRINNEIKDLTEKRNIIEVRKLFTVYFFFALLVSGCFTCPTCELLSTRTIFSRTHRGWKILKVR